VWCDIYECGSRDSLLALVVWYGRNLVEGVQHLYLQLWKEQIKLIPSQPKSKHGEKKSTETRKENNLSLISPKEIENEVINGTQIIILVA